MFAQLKEFMTQAVPYWRTLGLELKEVLPGRAVFEAESRADLMQNAVVHGGVLASMADSACAVAGISKVFPANYATTVNLQVAYLKPLGTGKVSGGREVREGREDDPVLRGRGLRRRKYGHLYRDVATHGDSVEEVRRDGTARAGVEWSCWPGAPKVISGVAGSTVSAGFFRETAQFSTENAGILVAG